MEGGATQPSSLELLENSAKESPGDAIYTCKT